MKYRWLLILPIPLAIAICFISAAHTGTQRTVKAPPNLVIRTVDTAAGRPSIFDTSRLEAFLREALKVHPYESFEIGAYFIGHLNGGNRAVFMINQNCTSDPVEIVITSASGQGVRLQVIRTHRGELLRDLRDINGDWKYEVVAHSVLAESTCHAECVEWDTVYEWNGEGYVDASAKFPQYYKDVYIPRLEKRLADLEACNPNRLAENDKHTAEWWRQWKDRSIADCHMGIDKARRLLGENPKAGFQRAVGWLKSDDVQLKYNAVKVFFEIADDASVRNLQIAAQDSNKRVARMAELAMAELALAELQKRKAKSQD